MNEALNSTHDPALKSWVDSANDGKTDFPIQNLPFAEFRRAGTDEEYRGGVAIGDQILDLAAVQVKGLFPDQAKAPLAACCEPTLNRFMAMGAQVSSLLRRCLSDSLKQGARDAEAMRAALVPQSAAQFTVPAAIGDYTDFYASIHHATTVGAQFRPDNPLLPNYRWIPIAYHGRSSSIGVDQRIHRPVGQSLPKGVESPVFGPTRRLDFELEVGIFIGAGNAAGESIAIADAEKHIFGLCLLNDWSARDLQGWEYQPLGPFLAKNFATTISPWIVTVDALAPFRLPFSRPVADPQPLPYLESAKNRAAGAADVHLEVSLQTESMRAAGLEPQRLASTNLRYAYWTMAQMIAHHTVNGCNLRAGDVLGSGTMSGPSPAEAGSLLELTDAGKRLITLSSNETRTFLKDGDSVLLRGWCERAGYARVGFGVASATVLAARAGVH